MSTFSRWITSLAATAAVAAGVAACGSAASDPVAVEANNQALVCQSGGLHVEGCPIVDPPPLPKPLMCTLASSCRSGFTRATSTSYDPLYVPEADGGYATASSFTSLLAGCGPEYTLWTIDNWRWATAACPASVASAVNAFGAANGSTAGEMPCDDCTYDPYDGVVAVTWLIGPGWEPYCQTDDAGVERCYQPGGGCKTIGCMTY